jgi:pimeloyl-[acyl-carrier protein] synthase
MDFNPHDPTVRQDPYAAYRELREQDPVHRSSLGLWFVTRYGDADTVLRDRRCGRNFDRFLDLQIGSGPLRTMFSGMMLYHDPPDHTRLRGLVAKVFTPRLVASLQPFIEQLVDDLLDVNLSRGSLDVIGDLAYPLPALVICQLLGIPIEDRQTLRAWSRDLSAALDYMLTPEVVERANRAAQGSSEYLTRLVAERRRRPQQDLISMMLAAEEGGGRLSENEIVSTCMLLFGAGHETTTSVIGTSILALLQNPDQLALLIKTPTLLPHALDELLRYDCPIHMAGRVAGDRIEVGGHAIEPGEIIVIILAAANRDPDRFPDPDRLDLRRPGNTPLSFGGGLRYCLGSALAKVEAQAALHALLARCRDMHLATSTLQWRETVVFRGLESLPITFKARS